MSLVERLKARSGSEDLCLEAVSAIERLQLRLLEAEVRAYKWMEAHDKLKAGKPYKFPEPADVPALQQRVEVLEGALRDIARYDVGHQALVEDDADTPENLARYYASQVERRRKKARAALGKQD